MAYVVEVQLWGRRIGALAWLEGEPAASFQYDPDFLGSRVQIAPLTMPLSSRVYSFPALARGTFHGLPGLLADALPDKFGHAVIDTWLARQGRSRESFGPLERLCYIGDRAMGAMSFLPALGPVSDDSGPLEVDALVKLANEVLGERKKICAAMPADDPHAGLLDILRVGTSAGGARAKALVAWNPRTGEVRSGQLDGPPGFSQWLLKFDGVSNNRDKELVDPMGYGAIEYAYHRMAQRAGVTMTECRLLEEDGRRHFMTRRFDRPEAGGRLHVQSLGAMAHLDFEQAGAHGYELAFQVMRQLQLPMDDVEQQFRRMVFNLVARNQDDHVKNIAFLMNKRGRWSLSPAYDVTYAFNPGGSWTSRHQMTVNGKADDFELDDLKAAGEIALLKRGRAMTILDEVVEAVRAWPEIAREDGVETKRIEAIARSHRLTW